MKPRSSFSIARSNANLFGKPWGRHRRQEGDGARHVGLLAEALGADELIREVHGARRPAWHRSAVRSSWLEASVSISPATSAGSVFERFFYARGTIGAAPITSRRRLRSASNTLTRAAASGLRCFAPRSSCSSDSSELELIPRPAPGRLAVKPGAGRPTSPSTSCVDFFFKKHSLHPVSLELNRTKLPFLLQGWHEVCTRSPCRTCSTFRARRCSRACGKQNFAPHFFSARSALPTCRVR